MNGTFSGLPQAGVVKCTITCRAVDPQTEHAEPDKTESAPQHPVIVSCSWCWTAFRYSTTEIFKGQPSPSSTCSQRLRAEAGIKGAAPDNKEEEKKPNGAILIAASLIAAVRLNREEIKPSSFSHCKDLGQYPPRGDDPGEVEALGDAHPVICFTST